MKLNIPTAILCTALLTCLAGPTDVKAQSFEPGTTVINAGIGLGSSLGYYSGTSRTPILSISGEYGVTKLGPGTLGLGLAFGYQGASYTQSDAFYTYKEKWSTSIFGVRGTYHPEFLQSDKYDIYGVLQLSYEHSGYTFTSNDPYYNRGLYSSNSLNSGVRAYLLVGARYYFTKAIGAYAELGYDIAYLKIGLAIKIDKKS